MKKRKEFSISLILVLIISLGITSFGSSYNCAGSRNTDKTLQVKIVNNNSLNNIFGSNWTESLQLLFGPGAQLKNAKMKIAITEINQNIILNFTKYPNLTNIEVCELTSNIWYWTLEGFDQSTPDVTGHKIQIMNNPDNLTTWTQAYSTNMSDPSNVTMKYVWAKNWLAYVPVPPSNYLRDLLWEENYTIDSSIITHKVDLPYFVQIDNSTKVHYFGNATEKFTYDSVYGALIDYTLRDENGTVAYRYTVVLPPLIPGFNIVIMLGSIGIMMIIGAIYFFKKKK
jgi:hypothetical protein